MESTVILPLSKYESMRLDLLELDELKRANSNNDRYVIVYREFRTSYVIKNANEADDTLIADIEHLNAHNKYLQETILKLENNLKRIEYLEVMANKNWFTRWLLNYKKSPET